MSTEALNTLADHITALLGEKQVSSAIAYGDLSIVVASEHIIDVLTLLRDDANTQFHNIVDVCGVDYPSREKRFEVVYHLLSLTKNHRVRIKVAVGEDDVIPSVIEVFPGATWFEREAYDMFGILFTGHPDMRRLLTDYGFDGHPLRKDFPTTGYVEVRYDDASRRVVYEPVKLAQEFRNFDFLSPWEGTDYILPGDEKAKAN